MVKWLQLILLIYCGIASSLLQANILLQGEVIIGDNNNSAITPTLIVSGGPREWIPIQPSHFHLSQNTILTAIELQDLRSADDELFFVIWNSNGDIIVDATGRDRVIINNLNLTAGDYRIIVVGQCFNPGGNTIGFSTQCDNNNNFDWDDFSFNNIELITNTNSDSFAFIQRRHGGDSFDSPPNGYLDRFYPDAPEGTTVTYEFTPNTNRQLITVDINGLRDVFTGEILNEVRIQDLDGDLDFTFPLITNSAAGDFSFDLSANDLQLIADHDYEISLITGVRGDADDFSWDDVVLKFANNIIACPDISQFKTIYSNDFNSDSDLNGFTALNYNRNISNWPGENIFNSGSENQEIQFGRRNNSLAINGGMTSEGDNEYGSVNFDLASLQYDPTDITRYSIEADLFANGDSATNNDVALIFGFADDENYYLARWTKYGTVYSEPSSFPGIHRNLEIIRVQNGRAQQLAVVSDFFADDPIQIQLTVNDDGITFCTNGVQQLFVPDEQPPILQFGFYSYDNDIGTFWDNLIVKCLDCEQLETQLHYPFDECEYDGSEGEVKDIINNNDGTAINGANTQSDGVINRALMLNDAEQYVATSVELGKTWSIGAFIHLPINITTGDKRYVFAGTEEKEEIMVLDRNKNFRWSVRAFTTNNNDEDDDDEDDEENQGRLRKINGDFEFGSLSPGWHYVVLVGNSDTTQLYVDGEFKDEIEAQAQGTLTRIGNSVRKPKQGFRTAIDEFVVYNQALSPELIQLYYDNQLAGLNFDGEPRATVVCNNDLLHYRFEEDNFNNGIFDETGNGNTGVNLGGVPVENGRYCRGIAVGSNSSSQTEDAFRTNLRVDDDIGNQGSISFWFNANTDWNQGGFEGTGERVLFDASKGGNVDKYFVLEINNNGLLDFRFEDSNDGDFQVIEPQPALRLANTWYYISVTWDYENNEFQIFVDGVLRINATQNTNGRIGDLDFLHFGDNATADYSANGNSSLASRTSANGRFDEVRVFNTILSANQILQNLNESFGCDAIVNHYRFSYTGNGLTCEAKPLTLTACLNESCSQEYELAATVNLLPDGYVGIDDNDNITFTSSTNLELAHTVAETIFLGLENSIPNAPVRCFDGSIEIENCALTFDSVGFRLFDGPQTGIGDQIAENPFSFAIQAVKDELGVCKTLFSGTQEIQFALECTNPNTCQGSTDFTLNNQPINQYDENNLGDFTTVNIPFDNDGVANISAVYDDAGQVTLRAQFVLDDLLIEGASSIRVRPDRFVFTSQINGQSANATTTQIAGDNFSFTIQAQGINGGLTPNYRPGDFALLPNLLLPNAGFDGDFTIANGQQLSTSINDFTSVNLGFSQGEYEFFQAQFSEVGVITVDLRDHSYLGNLQIDGDIFTLGRFIPAYFTVVPNQIPQIDPACSGFTYLDQNFTWLLEPDLNITAKNRQDNTTRNYQGNFSKLTPVIDEINYQDNAAVTPFTNIIEGSLVDPGFSAGSLDLQVINSEFVYQKTTTLIAPFATDFDQEFSEIFFTDTDNVCAFDVGDGIKASCQLLTFENIGISEQRYGRLLIEDTFGPETEALRVPLITEFYDGTTFRINTLDSCSTLDTTQFTTDPVATIVNIDSLQGIAVGGGVTDASFNNLLIGGDANFILSAPGEGNTGVVTIEFLTLPLHLQFYWDNTTLSVPPPARITFGQFRGNDRAIYWRENE